LTVPAAVLAWSDRCIVKLAAGIYQERELPSGHLDNVRLAVLADALEEAGADDFLVDHLRSSGLHCRGCFVVDSLLGKS
jgi:hypothetical protein